MNKENDAAISDFLVYIVELAAEYLFNADKTLAFNILTKSKVLDYYKETYDVSHTLGTEYLLNEIKELIK